MCGGDLVDLRAVPGRDDQAASAPRRVSGGPSCLAAQRPRSDAREGPERGRLPTARYDLSHSRMSGLSTSGWTVSMPCGYPS
ncbi:hypothetical protein GCM10010233_50130 [Streptomyces pseudogriseolus]|nr:hypothetical protein GCM10010233_50130 [Streptomyces gancidicus]